VSSEHPGVGLRVKGAALGTSLTFALSACSLLAPSDDKLLGQPDFRPSDAAADSPHRDAPAGSGGSGGSAIADASNPQPEMDAQDAYGGVGNTADASEAAAGSCTVAADCAEGRYCSPEGACKPCSDIASMELTDVRFGEPEPLAAVNASANDEGLRFPRAFDRGTKLFYERAYFGANSIWLTGDYEQNEGAPLGFPIDGAGPEGGALAVTSVTGVLSEFNFFFTRNLADGGLTNDNHLFAARMDAAGVGSSVTQLAAPFNAAPRHSQSLALSRDRAWWTVNVDGVLNIQLWTVPLIGDLIPSRVSLSLANGCGIIEFDYTPWATPDGRLLFISFRERERDETCTHIGNENSTDVGVLKLTSAGQAQGPVVPLNVNRPVLSDTDASLSQDQCWLYFSSSRHESGRLRLYRARRTR
jgi:hypothetical protein